MELLQSEDPTTQMQAAAALVSIDPRAALPVLCEYLTDEAAAHRTYAAYALAHAPEPEQATLDSLAQCLTDVDPAVRLAAAHTLAVHGDGRGRSVLVDAADSADPGVRAAAATGLGSLAQGASDDPPTELWELLQDPDERVRLSALWALRQANPDQDLVSAHVVPLLDGQSLRVRVSAASVLAKVQDPSGLDVLLSGLDSDESDIRLHAARSLVWLRGLAKPAEDRLVELIAADDAPVQTAAALTLGGIGPDAGSATPALHTLLDHPDPLVRHAAAIGLASVEGSPDAVPVLLDSLRGDDPGLRAQAAAALGYVDAADSEAIAALKAVAEEGTGQAQVYANTSLALLGRDADLELLREASTQAGPGHLLVLAALAASGDGSALRELERTARTDPPSPASTDAARMLAELSDE
jgi:HEAT repeat protein